MKQKAIKTFILFFTIILSVSYGQGKSSNSQLFLIHQDQVLPHMAEKYEAAFKNLKDLLSESNSDMEYNVVQTEYFTYSAIMSVKDYNGLAKHPFITGEMGKNIDKENFSSAMNNFDGCYDSHKSFLLKLRHDLSYKGKYGLDPKDDLNFRHFDYFYFVPGKEDEMIKLLKEMKSINEANDIQQGYRIYQGDLGVDSPMILLVKSFKDRISWAKESDEISKKLGEQQNELRKKMIAIMQKFEHKNGYMRHDLGNMK